MEAMNFCLQRRNFCFFFIPPARLEEDEAERKKNIRGFSEDSRTLTIWMDGFLAVDNYYYL